MNHAPFDLIAGARGASRLYLGPESPGLVSEHRAWLHEAYSERADEAPGLVKALAADGHVVEERSGWALGPELADGRAARLEEVGEEYRYQVAIGGAAAPLEPPDDFWLVAAAVGHPASPLGAVVLWRPREGSSRRDPADRREELWIAAIDRRTPAVLASRALELTLPADRTAGVLIGGTREEPVLALVGVPDPGGAGAYQVVGLKLPSLDPAWTTSLDVAAAERERAIPGVDAAAESAPAPAPHVDAASLREWSAIASAALGDGSGWIVAHGTRLRAIHTTTLAFLVERTGTARPLYELGLPDAAQLGPVDGEPAIWALAMAGPRDRQQFLAVERVWPRTGRRDTPFDRRTRVAGQALADALDRQPIALAARGRALLAAAATTGDGFGVDAPDVAGRLTTPASWHRPDRPRVVARQTWLDARTRP